MTYWHGNRKYQNMKTRIPAHGGVAILVKALGLHCGLRLALDANPSFPLGFASSGCRAKSHEMLR